MKTYNLRPYTPPTEYALAKLNAHWLTLLEAEGARKRAITIFLRDSKDLLRRQYADAANGFQETLNAVSLSLQALGGELETQLAISKDLIQQSNPLKTNLEDLSALDAQCIEAGIEDNEYTIYSVEDLSFELSILMANLLKKSVFIENQIVARSKTNFTPEQLEQYSETFRLFDKDNSNGLIREEFKAALQAEGTSLNAEEFEVIFTKLSGGNDEINFEQVFTIN